MAEEVEQESTGKSFKNIIIGLVSTVTLGVGGFITNKLTGGDDEPAPAPAAAPVINITNSNQQAQSAGKTVVIKEKTVGAAPAAPATKSTPVKKKEGDEFKEEAPKW
jgi:hypothetical protein